ncbi:PDZ domain-containing protein [bacterium]|nr:PDZ domain-containing protein [bacterium]
MIQCGIFWGWVFCKNTGGKSLGFGHIGRRFWGLVRTLTVCVLSAVLLSSLVSPKTKSENPQLSCKSIIPVFKWSVDNHGLGSQPIHSPAFAKKAVAQILKKLDPQFLLFTTDEVELLNFQTLKTWTQLIQNGNCTVQKKWLETMIPRAQARLEKGLKTWQPQENQSKLKNQIPRYTTFAASDDELQTRQNIFLTQTFWEVPELVRSTYGDRYQQLLKDRLEEWFQTIHQDPGILLAKALLAALDPYSTYFSSPEFAEFYEDLSGNSAGIGIEVQKTFLGLGVTSVALNSPAEKAQVRRGDEIMAINGTALEGRSFSEATELLKGQESQVLKLTLKKSNSEVVSLELKKSPLVFDDKRVSVKHYQSQLNQSVAIITIPSFYGRGGMSVTEYEEKSSSEDVKRALLKLNENPGSVEALVLDLRGNPGGYLEEAVATAGYFLGAQTVVGVKENSQVKKLQPVLDSGVPLYQGPLVVWVDEETASAGEVLAAALKDYQRAILVGAQATFGKGSVQKLFQLDDPFLNLPRPVEGGVVKLTTSVFYSPLGHTPLNGGVSTHIQIQDEKKAETLSKAETPVSDVAPLIDPSTCESLKKQQALVNGVVEEIQNKQITDNQQPELSKVVDIAVEIAKSGWPNLAKR